MKMLSKLIENFFYVKHSSRRTDSGKYNSTECSKSSDGTNASGIGQADAQGKGRGPMYVLSHVFLRNG
ncbi:hypothetical protein N7G274_005485 [Stereocaulon virgatum]|uniref:Uncharacterized protein n=1 Tax=Stereocaulon virgatum TaxID=373712 RepID=A0ABR4A9X3_9LECA